MVVCWPFHGRAAEVIRARAALTGRGPAGTRGVLLVGAAGAGKSWLIDEVRRTLPELPLLEGSEGTRTVPLGALAPLLPERMDPGTNRWRCAAEALTGAVVCVDDAHLLDPMSAALLQRLVHDGELGLLAAVRTGAAMPDGLRRLSEDRFLDRLELAPFTPAETSALLGAALGAVSEAATARLHERSRGNPLLLRELALTAVDSGELRLEDGQWGAPPGTPPGPPAARITDRVADLVENRIGGYGQDRPQLREVLELVALGQPLELSLLLGLVDVRLVEEAEDRGLLTLADEGRRTYVRTAHPLYAEVATARCPRLRGRRHHRALVRAVEAAGARRAGDALRLAEWRLAGGLTEDPVPLLAGARAAWAAYDTASAVRLASAARDAGGGTEAALLLAEALSWAERYEEAERVLRECAGLAMSDVQRIRHAVLRAHGLSWGLRSFADAERALDEAESAVNDPALRWEAGARRVALVGAQGDFTAALGLAGRLLARPVEPRRTGALLTTTAVAHAYTGRPEEARREVARAAALLGREPAEVLPLRLAEFAAEFWAGSLDGADRAADAFAELLRRRGDWPVAERSVDALYGAVLLWRGRPGPALARFRAGIAARGPGYYDTSHLGGAAHAAALAGDAARAESHLAAADRGSAAVPVVFDQWTELARPWVAAAGGRVTRAVELARGVADGARAAALPGFELLALHDAARLGGTGGARSVAARMREVAAAHQGALAAVCAAHVAALAGRSGTGLWEAAQEFERLGYGLFAAEAAAGAARIAPGAAARAAAARAHMLAARCAGVSAAAVPALAGLAAPALTPREREIAALAAQGLASRAIADRLILSPRTVDNHLTSIYAKLGIPGRTDLAAVLAP
ncbi:LuxR C-terminal-related transcriptional regulator [Streptomyces sp. NPDC051183]|uniref:helix-turn-helix transcriptional regulator n=1 Tax=Streptomyces sp. NPDC051183 TaxID=3155165 RepID=UPI00344523F9